MHQAAKTLWPRMWFSLRCHHCAVLSDPFFAQTIFWVLFPLSTPSTFLAVNRLSNKTCGAEKFRKKNNHNMRPKWRLRKVQACLKTPRVTTMSHFLQAVVNIFTLRVVWKCLCVCGLRAVPLCTACFTAGRLLALRGFHSDSSERSVLADSLLKRTQYTYAKN